MALSLSQKKKKKQDLSNEGTVSQFRFYKNLTIFLNFTSQHFLLRCYFITFTTAKSVCSVLPRSNSLIVKCLTFT